MPKKIKYFEITGIKPPGKVNIFKMGTIKLHEASDELLLKIHNSGKCPNVKLTAAGFKKYFPKKNPIQVIKTGNK